ncbi:hypothetical protein AA103196_2359 [Ameyamaea chiangmaiensis NBRC 103196]|uniref:Hint domain-containing protein n=1 Tax=Ameyamaea chiangmaiensis TaxID=442969 RepID=A0A850PFH2_9PROT|nr:Hint domain-containing protein [Ameyamaea chiangmaiensis]MBS4075382.1 Hint domain-containing protein [Ameyamaea chiangmaiensis]NVN39871.1 Hint domain-containing protein [Ameyamaea chiangmaiensis]GBQ69949.1 hypothetical protein AA103196_2359 [Ameyamaea chiangmaiensis NBRC 103196]
MSMIVVSATGQTAYSTFVKPAALTDAATISHITLTDPDMRACIADFTGLETLSALSVSNGAHLELTGEFSALRALASLEIDGGTLEIDGSTQKHALLNSLFIRSGGATVILGTGLEATPVLEVTEAQAGDGGQVTSHLDLIFSQATSVDAVYDARTNRTQLTSRNISDSRNGTSVILSGNPYRIITDAQGLGSKVFYGVSDANPGAKICFFPGSHVRTQRGEVLVEELMPGDMAVAHAAQGGNHHPIRRVERRRVSVRRHLPPYQAGYPVIIRRHALRHDMPYKDMKVLPDHCVEIGGRLMPARMLVNGISITFDMSTDSYDYFHVETDDHLVLLANGTPTAAHPKAAHPDAGPITIVGGTDSSCTWERDAAAPLCTDPAKIAPIYQELASRARALDLHPDDGAPRLTDDPGLMLVTSKGRVLRQAKRVGGLRTFMLPSGVEAVWVVSHVTTPLETGSQPQAEARSLGVLVGEVILNEAGHRREIAHHLKENHPGWYPLAPGRTDARWTDGQALLPLGRRTSNSISMLSLRILAGGPYLVSPGQEAIFQAPETNRKSEDPVDAKDLPPQALIVSRKPVPR